MVNWNRVNYTRCYWLYVLGLIFGFGCLFINVLLAVADRFMQFTNGYFRVRGLKYAFVRATVIAFVFIANDVSVNMLRNLFGIFIRLSYIFYTIDVMG
jgi:hypothetical protein